jgi:hypothetical protein
VEKLKRKHIVAAIVGVGLLAGTFFVGRPLWDSYQRGKISPELAFSESLVTMANAASYRYDLHSSFTLNDQTRIISEIAGEYAEGRVHIQGEMVNTPVDVYYIEGVLYNYDAQAEKWMLIESDFSSTAELLISELNPMDYLKYQNVSELEQGDFEKLDGEDCLKACFKPEMEQPLLREMWQDFRGVVWIDYKHQTIKQLELTAANKNNPATVLSINLQFSDIDQDIVIEAPDMT